MTLLGLSSSLDKNDSAWVVIVVTLLDKKRLCLGCHRPWTKMCLGCHRPWTKMTLLGLSSSLDKN